MLKSLKQRMTPEVQTPEQKLQKVAKLYEKQFLGEMMKAMRSTVHEGGFIKTSNAEKIFRDQLDSNYVDQWGDRGGIGLADMIYEQLVEKYGAQLGIKPKELKAFGPIQMREMQNFSVQRIPPPNQPDKTVSYQFSRIGNGASAASGVGNLASATPVQAPWDGVLTKSMQISPDETLIELAHKNGLQSQFVFKGSGSDLKVGLEVEGGTQVGLLSPEAKSLFWNIK